MSTITGINANTPSAATATTSSGSNQTLTQQDFLQIMVAQFTQQDPLASGSDSGGGSGTSDYVDQLMSMTNLTTMQTMSSQLATSTQQQALSLAGKRSPARRSRSTTPTATPSPAWSSRPRSTPPAMTSS